MNLKKIWFYLHKFPFKETTLLSSIFLKFLPVSLLHAACAGVSWRN